MHYFDEKTNLEIPNLCDVFVLLLPEESAQCSCTHTVPYRFTSSGLNGRLIDVNLSWFIIRLSVSVKRDNLFFNELLIVLDMVEYIYDKPNGNPQESSHWQSLNHLEGDKYIESLDELKEIFKSDMLSSSGNQRLSLWSCLIGYCEAVCTHKQQSFRYDPFPIPIDALQRLVDSEFKPPSSTSTHRKTAQEVSNWIWSKVVTKSNSKDELHANSLYIVLRGKVDGKSLDCFGSALVTVIGLRQLGYLNSTLTLSEDHAYESHPSVGTARNDSSDRYNTDQLSTCEVAIPGNTKAQQAKRGQEIAETFTRLKSQLTPKTSWLYMGMSPVYCNSTPMILGAALSNTNCLIESKGRSFEINSEPLLLIKRELLWILYDARLLEKFPFALCELGWSEEHCTSCRGNEMVQIPDLASISVTKMEALYYEAIQCSKSQYKDQQVYPYCYMGFFHKDSAREEGLENESRISIAVENFAEAARVASGYLYEWGDTFQLTKVMTKVSEFIVYEILSDAKNNSKSRTWLSNDNAITTTCWLLTFYNYLLLWEERSMKQFLPILSGSHSTGISKAFSLIPHDIRLQAFSSSSSCTTSQRLKGLLGKALQAKKVSLSEMEFTILSSEGRGRRKRKER